MVVEQNVKNVCNQVSNYGLCIGCGVCAGVCPTRTLGIEFDVATGQLVAKVVLNACVDCGVCLESCPFWAEQKYNEDSLGEYLFSEEEGVNYDARVGYYFLAMCGYSKVSGHRENGASGGMATWFLEHLLSLGIVDRVFCVKPMDKVGRLFSFVICSSVDEIRDSSRSCYYPVELSKVVKFILQNSGRYAIICLPCLLKSLRLAMRVNRTLHKRIMFLLGLVCGQGKSAFFSEYICALGGGDPLALDSVRFRVKDHNRRPKDHGVKFSCSSGSNNEFNSVKYMSEGPGKLWSNRYFTPLACTFCDDTFAELADIVFMDAWLPQFAEDGLGNSLLIVRNIKALEVLRNGISENELMLSEVSIDEVVRSQHSLLHSKRDIIHYRCKLAKNEGYPVPKKRDPLFLKKVSFLEKQLTKITWIISKVSSRKWYECSKNIEKFDKSIFLLKKRAQFIRKIEKLSLDPLGVIQRVFCKAIKKIRERWSRS